MNLHLLPSPIWWAIVAGESRAHVSKWMGNARNAKSLEGKKEAVRIARKYHRDYLLCLHTALIDLNSRDRRITMLSVPSDVLPVHRAHSPAR